MKNLKTMALLAIAATMVFTACKKDDDDNTSPSSPSAIPVVNEGGSVTGTLKGQRADGDSFSYNFNYTGSIYAIGGIVSQFDDDGGNGPYEFTIAKATSISDLAAISFTLADLPVSFPFVLTPLNSTNVSVQVGMIKSVNDTLLHAPQFNAGFPDVTIIINEFDRNTLKIKGTFSGTSYDNPNSGMDMKVMNGTFETKLKRVVNKK